MISVKAVLRKKPNPEGKLPITIRVTKDQKTSYIYTGIYTFEKDWDKAQGCVKNSYPNSARVNNLLRSRINEINEIGLVNEQKKKTYTAKFVAKEHKSHTKGRTFFPIAEQYLDNLKKRKKYNQLTADRPRVNHFREYLKGIDPQFEEITPLQLKSFSAWLRDNRNVTERTAMNHLVVIRTIFNLAIRSEVVEAKFYPFGRGKIVIKFPDAQKIGLTREEVRQLETCELDANDPQWHARNVWLLSFYLAGMRVSDVMRLKWADIHDGRLHYAMEKNSKYGSLKLPEQAITIISLYKDPENNGYIFPDIVKANFESPEDVTRKVNNATHVLNKHLKRLAEKLGIKKTLTMHIARHTFGNISGDKIPIQMLQKLYRHSSITTTIGYQSNFIFKDVDEALMDVIK